jgi:hypothetical protein
MHAGRRIDPNDAHLANSDLAKLARDTARLLDHSQELFALLRRSHGGAAPNRRPHGRYN